MASPPKIAIGFRVHSGWTAMVAVAGSSDHPLIVDRRRLEIADKSIPGTVQPYHTAKELGIARGRKFLDECRKSSTDLAVEALRRTAGLAGCLRAAILIASGRKSGSLEATLASHAAIHTAEGEFFREIVLNAAESRGLRVRQIKEKELFDLAAQELRRPVADLTAMLNDLGKIVGPPWRQDHKLAALAAWLA
jgi:hypothetical protein